MGAGGVIVPPRTYWQKIQAVCRKYDVLVIADEVITGFGRTGTPFASERFGIDPDILVLSKQITSSYLPLSAVLFTDKIYQGIADNSAQDRHLRPRLHRERPSGRDRGRRSRTSRSSRSGSSSSTRRRWASTCRRSSATLRRPSAGRRGARRRADRGGRDGRRQEDEAAVRSARQGRRLLLRARASARRDHPERPGQRLPSARRSSSPRRHRRPARPLRARSTRPGNSRRPILRWRRVTLLASNPTTQVSAQKMPQWSPA